MLLCKHVALFGCEIWLFVLKEQVPQKMLRYVNVKCLVFSFSFTIKHVANCLAGSTGPKPTCTWGGSWYWSFGETKATQRNSWSQGYPQTEKGWKKQRWYPGQTRYGQVRKSKGKTFTNAQGEGEGEGSERKSSESQRIEDQDLFHTRWEEGNFHVGIAQFKNVLKIIVRAKKQWYDILEKHHVQHLGTINCLGYPTYGPYALRYMHMNSL